MVKINVIDPSGKRNSYLTEDMESIDDIAYWRARGCVAYSEEYLDLPERMVDLLPVIVLIIMVWFLYYTTTHTGF